MLKKGKSKLASPEAKDNRDPELGFDLIGTGGDRGLCRKKLREVVAGGDLTPFPANRFMATLTLPIEGYIEKVKDTARKSLAKEKLR
ncbi:hypothetical protein NL676_038607 [Syzygium grande]|nr:hypothetical protein NL676_038607 [Syzygium grande]